MAHLITMPSVAKATHWKRLAQSRFVWCIAVVAIAGIRYMVNGGGEFLASLGDTDDATRLVQVRQFLAGAGWFDTQLSQIGVPEILHSHWSRLVDLPIAVLIGGLSLFVDADQAETITRLIWPLLVLVPLVYVVVREAEREAGQWARVIAAAVIVASPFALFQFMPGRIDHHNVQILLVAGGLVLLPRAVFSIALAPLVGAMIGLGLIVGFEALVLCGFVLGVAALFCCFVHDMRAGTVRVLVACAATVAVGFAATTAPDRWFDIACDAASLNLVALIGIGAGALWVLHRFAPRAGGLFWLGGLALGGGVAVAIYGGMEPACLAGPMGQVDARVGPIWLDHILEVQSLFAYSSEDPKVGVAYLATAVLALGVLGRQLRDALTAQRLFHFAVVAAAVGYGLIYVRLMPYAMWVVVPVIAIWIARLPGIGSVSQNTVRLGALVLLNPTVLLMAGQVLAGAALGHDATKDSPKGAVSGCERRAGMRLVGALEPGIVVADIDLGPHIAAHSRHRVVAAPYHRIDQSIILLDGILTASPSAAEARLRAIHARYVVLCAKPAKSEKAKQDQSFAARLRRGQVPGFLTPIALGEGAGALKAWRIGPVQR